MPDADRLAELFLNQTPGCQWMVSAKGVFERFFGDPTPLFGRPSPELIGRKPADVLEPDRAAAWSTRFSRALEGESVLIRERRGKDAWYVTVFPVLVEGEVLHAGGSAREITPWTNAEQELRHTVLGALKTQEFERAMLSKFLHDSVGQNLTALGLQLDLIRMDLETVAPDTCRRAIELQKVLEVMMESVREYSYELNPSTVERAGIRPALDRLAGRIRARYPGTLRVNVDPFLKIDPKVASPMYQIAQEAVENAVQHSRCSTIEIAVKSTRTGTVVEVRDNGRGFDPADLGAGRRGLGLLSMEHYATQAGLELSITSTREFGTTVRAATPETAER
ncbi:MAG: histidine kinase [Candidatus Solibacter sp.]|nr:histidine kinase [Candidatus Solibacter sp.]